MVGFIVGNTWKEMPRVRNNFTGLLFCPIPRRVEPSHALRMQQVSRRNGLSKKKLFTESEQLFE